MRLSQLM
ncbi:hypothetical protein B4U79_09234 [Dinothrombium tinctorium]|nr:hypothetical protein B4U79_06335 [Dinothrombium tinctorium]RWS05035.1 hypothetical protein B4U79_15304 [Dinothrombium tinctorium]RWS06348.1 hypothetical protein B4U79_09234 [Dinothrombium tinctorium]